MDRYNKLKLRTLSAFEFTKGQWLGPGEVAERIGFVPARAAWTYIKRLWKFGLLERRTSGKGTLQYRINDAGAARIRWLHSQQNR
jgi:hypothetical protein